MGIVLLIIGFTKMNRDDVPRLKTNRGLLIKKECNREVAAPDQPLLLQHATIHLIYKICGLDGCKG